MSEEENSTPLPKPATLHTAILNVMYEVKSIDKGMTVGSGNNSYKGVADKDVKYIIGQSMTRNGLTCVPIDMQPTLQVNEWEQEWNGNKQRKQSVFTTVICKFQLTHAKTGESIVICGYGHGVDPQDKGAGKATTYALKNALLYTFLVPTGQIDDTDNTHSKEIEVPQTPVKKPLPPIDEKKFNKYCDWILTKTEDNKGVVITVEYLKARHTLTDAQEQELANV